MPRLGAHMSIRGGFARSIDRGEETGCDTIQIFTKSNRQWQAAPMVPADIDAFHVRRAASIITPVFAHCSYLINLCAHNPGTLDKSLAALIDEIERAAALQLPFIVLHPGSFGERRLDEAIDLTADNIRRAIDATDRTAVRIVVEHMAGQGTVIGSTFEQIARINARVDHAERFGVCLDTCHLFAAGYDIGTVAGYEQTITAFDDIVGLDRLTVMHMNDSKTAAGSRVDRHQHIGQGLIGTDGLACFLNDPRLAHVPMVLETPVDNELEDDRMNLQALRALIR